MSLLHFGSQGNAGNSSQLSHPWLLWTRFRAILKSIEIVNRKHRSERGEGIVANNFKDPVNRLGSRRRRRADFQERLVFLLFVQQRGELVVVVVVVKVRGIIVIRGGVGVGVTIVFLLIAVEGDLRGQLMVRMHLLPRRRVSRRALILYSNRDDEKVKPRDKLGAMSDCFSVVLHRIYIMENRAWNREIKITKINKNLAISF